MASGSLHSADIDLSARGGFGFYRSAPIAIDPQTARLRAFVRRPVGAGIAWDERGEVMLSIVVEIDGIEFRASTGYTGGAPVHRGKTEAVAGISYSLPTGFFRPGRVPKEQWAAQRVKRLGETAKTVYRAWVEVLRLSGNVVSSVELWGEVAPAPSTAELGWDYHESITYDTASSASAGYASGAITLSHTATGSDRLALVTFGTNDNAAIGHTVTYAGNAPSSTPIAVRDSGSDTGGSWQRTTMSVFKDALLGTGAQTVSGAPDSGGPGRAMAVVTLAGVDQTTPTGGAAIAGSTSSGTHSATATSVGSTDLVVDGWARYAGDVTVGANQTSRINETDDDVRVCMSTQAGSDGGVMTWTQSGGGEYAGGALAVKEVSAGGGGGQPTTKRFGGVPFMGGHGAGFPSVVQRW